MSKIPHNSPSAKPPAQKKVEVARKKTDWWVIRMLLLFFGVGLAVGAFVLAPLYWPDRINFPLRCLGAFVGASLALFPGTLLFGLYEITKDMIRRKWAKRKR